MTRNQIIKAIGCPHLSLFKGNGYWYFVYDDQTSEYYETKSVYTQHLHDLALAEWVSEGTEFVALCQQS